jgi:hypothetical protein
MIITLTELNGWISDLEEHKITPDFMVDTEFQTTLLDAAIRVTNVSPNEKIKLIEKLISLGCDVDGVQVGCSAIETAIFWSEDNDYVDLIRLLLSHHKKHENDLNIMKCSLGALHANIMFNLVVTNENINVNTISIDDNTHILHILSAVAYYVEHLNDILTLRPDIDVNPINKDGYSPMTVALLNTNTATILAWKQNKHAMLIGYDGKSPVHIVKYEIVDRYIGNFWKDYPAMLTYAVKSEKKFLLPEKIQNLLF